MRVLSALMLLFAWVFSACAGPDASVMDLDGNWSYAVGGLADTVQDAGGKDYRPLAKLSNLERLVPGGEGVVWLRRVFDGGPLSAESRLSLLMGKIAIADETYLNGHFAGGKGRFPGKTGSFFSAWNQYRRYNLSREDVLPGRNVLLVKVYVNHEGELYGKTAVGNADRIEALFASEEFYHTHLHLLNMFLFFAIALFSFFIYYQLRNRKEQLYYGLACLFFAFFELNFVVMRMPGDIVGTFSYLIYQKFVFSFTCTAFFFFLLFIRHFFNDPSSRKLAAVFALFTLAPAASLFLIRDYGVFMLFGKAFIGVAASFTIAYSVYFAVRCLAAGKPNALSFLLGLGILFAVIAHDLVVHVIMQNNIGPYFGSYGLSVFIFVSGFLLSHDFVSYHKKVETLNTALAEQFVRLRLAEDALEEEKERLAVTLGSIAEGVIVTDSGGSVRLLSRKAESLLGCGPECGGRKIGEIFRVTRAATAAGPVRLEEIVSSGDILDIASGEYEVGDGGSRSFSGSVAPLHDRSGTVIGRVFAFRDTTDEIRLQHELQRVIRLESLGTLAGGIAHDFNNILTAIIGNINLARHHAPAGSELAALLAEAENSSLRAKGLTNQLLTFARGGAPIKKTAPVETIIRESAGFVLRGTNIRCEYEFEPGLKQAFIDVDQFSQVVQNLVINACQAMPGGGTLTVSAENEQVDEGNGLPLRPGPYIKIMFTDTGTGISLEDLPRIFDPYFTTGQTGSGLGLTSAHSIIKKHEGHITVRSSSGEGAVFTVYLPVSAETAAAEEIKSRPLFSGRQRILLVEDEQEVARAARKMLEFLGLQVDTAGTDGEAMRLFHEARGAAAPYHAVILDLTLVGSRGGREILSDMLAVDPDVVAVVSSGYSNNPIMSDYAKYGFRGVLAKPYRMEELSEQLGRLLGEMDRSDLQ